MSKKQNELKNALQNLKVNEALRLSKGQAKDFAFRPPEPSEIKSSSAPLEPSPTASQISGSSVKTDLNSSESQSISSSGQKKLRSDQSQFPSSRDDNVPRVKPSPIKASSDKSDSTGFDLSPFLTEINKIELVERSEGTFHIPHKIYEFVHKAVDTKVELLVFNCLLRYTLGFQRATCSASQSFISRWTGIAVPNVRKALKSLIERRFIRRLEEGTIAHDSAVYELPIVTAYLAYDQVRKLGAAFTKSPEIEKHSDRNDLGSVSVHISDQIDSGSGINSIPKKEIENKDKTLSQKLPLVLRRYFSEQLPALKREREWKVFQSLEEQFDLNQIEQALEFVLRNGALENRASVHSPMAYLSLSIRDVLKKVCEEARQQEIKKRELLELEEKRRSEESDALAFKQMESAFCRAFPSAEHQERVIHEICKRERVGWKPQGQVARSIAIQTWWEQLSQQERSTMGVL